MGMRVATMKEVGMIKRAIIALLTFTISFAGLQVADAAAKPIAKLKISRSSVASSSGVAFTTQPVVNTVDSSNDDVKTAGNVISASITAGAGGTLIGTTTATTSNQGKATFTNLGITGTAGATYTITYTYNAFTISENVTLALNAALTPTFGTYTATADGFTVVIPNYDTAYTWAGTATRSGTVSITGTDGNGLATISGVAANTASVATITTARSGYQNGSAASASTTSLRAGLVSTTGDATSTFGGFTFTITNYNASYTYGLVPTAGTVDVGTPTGSNLPVSVTGLTDGQSATIAITTTRSGYAQGNATKTGSAKTSALTPTTGDPGAWNSSAISDDGKYVLFAGNNSKLFVSPDSGENWSDVASAKAWTSVAVSGDGAKMIAAGTKTKIYYSSDFGATWSSKGATRNWRALAANSDGSKLFAAVQNGFIYRSTNNGSSWTQLGISKNWRALAASQNGNILIAAAFGGNLYTSTNGGNTWTSRELVRNWSSVTISNDGTVMMATVGNGFVYISTDTGNTWSQVQGTERNNWSSIACDSSCRNVAVVNVSGNLFVLIMAGAVTAGATNGSTASKWSTVTLNNAGTQLIAGATTGVIRRSTDSAATFTHRTRIQQ